VYAQAINVTGAAAIAGVLNVDSGVLYVDIANNRVGVNDTTPSYPLDVNGDARIVGDLYMDGGFGGTWANLTLTSPWVSGAGNSVVGYRKVGDFVVLRGRPEKTAAAFSAGATIGTLPAGYRPVANVNFICHAGNFGKARITVNAAGAIVVEADSDNWNTVGNWLAIDGCIFMTT